MNDQNLKPVRTTSEARERGKNGGIASGKARRRISSIREAMKLILSEKTSSPFADEMVTNAVAIALAQAERAKEGDTSAAIYCRDTIGEKPSDKVDLGAKEDSVEVNIKVVGGGENNAEDQS